MNRKIQGSKFKAKTRATFTVSFYRLLVQRKFTLKLNNQIFIIPSKNFTASDRRPTSDAGTIKKFKVTFVTAVTVKQKRALLQQGNWQCGDGEHMECEVVRESGQNVQCEVLADSGQSVQCEVLTGCGQTVQCEVL